MTLRPVAGSISSPMFGSPCAEEAVLGREEGFEFDAVARGAEDVDGAPALGVEAD